MRNKLSTLKNNNRKFYKSLKRRLNKSDKRIRKIKCNYNNIKYNQIPKKQRKSKKPKKLSTNLKRENKN